MQPLALTLGEPAGIGPDLALAVWQRRAEYQIPAFYVVGDGELLGDVCVHSNLLDMLNVAKRRTECSLVK